MQKLRQVCSATIFTAGALVNVIAHAADSGADEQTSAKPVLEEIIVTGVLSATSIEDAPISITAVSSEQIGQQALNSAADLLKTVPGVFVNSSLGEIRNVVFSRGVSANSLDAAGGYFYVSLQEDGLPVEAITMDNFGPDYFARTDIMLDRLEALRGGTAAITGPNAPGGIFNYLSRTGKSHPHSEASFKYGAEGDGRNDYYRGELYTGGQIGTSDLYYSIGGFYRENEGPRAPEFDLNNGGQLRANLLWEYHGGSVLTYVKYLDDHSAWFEFIPAFNFKNPKIAHGFDNYSSVLPPAAPHSYVDPDGKAGRWDGSDKVHAKGFSFGVNWSHQLTDTIHLDNKARWNDNRSDWNTGALIFAAPATDLVFRSLLGVLGAPGTITYRYQDTGAIAAQVQSVTGLDATVTASSLPNQNVVANGMFSQLALAQEFETKEFQDQFTLNFNLGNHNVALGAYVMTGDLRQDNHGAGIGMSTVTPRPQLFDITFELQGGPTYQVTDPAGFANHGGLSGGDYVDGDQTQYSLFLGDTWNVNDRLSLDAGVRYENIEYDIANNTVIAFQGNPFAVGGVDGNPLTLYDNARRTFGTPTRVKRDFDFFAYTGSASYRFTDTFQAYVRYTNGQKAPDFGLIAAIDEPGEIATQFPDPQKIEQMEVGLKYLDGGLSIQAFPFYSKLSDVATSVTFLDAANAFYSPPAVFGQIETYGVEVQVSADVGAAWNLYGALTLQDPKASDFSTWTPGPTNSRDDDVLITIPDGDADNNPKIIARGTATWRPTDALSLFATYSYLGKRAANRFNAWYMPGFSTVDVGAQLGIGEHVKVQLNVNNLFNEYGVMSWARGGSLLAGLDRQGLTPADVRNNPNQPFAIVPSQPRAFYLTTTVSF